MNFEYLEYEEDIDEEFVIGHNTISQSDISLQEEFQRKLDKQKIDDSVWMCYNDLKKYAINQGVDLLDECDYETFYNFMIK